MRGRGAGDGEKAIRSMDLRTWDEVGDEALWWQLYLASDDHQRMAAQLLLSALVLLIPLAFLSYYFYVFTSSCCFCPYIYAIHCSKSDRASEPRRGSAMIIFNTFDRLQNKSGNIIEHLYLQVKKSLSWLNWLKIA